MLGPGSTTATIVRVVGYLLIGGAAARFLVAPAFRRADDEKIATIDEHTSFIKGVNAGTIAATGRVIRKGRRVAFADGEVRDAADGALLSRTSTSFAVIGR